MNSLVFVKVTKVILDNSNMINAAAASDGERIFSHFCGFAVTEDGTSVWFKKSAFRPIYIAGVTHTPRLEVYADYPVTGSLLVGKTRDSEKGKVMKFWCHHAEPLREFRDALNAGPKSISSRMRSFSKLKTRCTRSGTEDDLWCLARLYLLKDVGMFVREYMPEEKRVRHPVRATNGICIERNILEFVFFASFFARDPDILVDFLSNLGGLMPAEAERYTPECLHALLRKS